VYGRRRAVNQSPESRRAALSKTELLQCAWGLHLAGKMEVIMDWDRVSGNWKQIQGKVKEKWGRLTDDDLKVINGQRDQLEGKLQERYGYAKDQARKDVDAWFNATTWR
jgi:uncharacterized protein YjbJ (UPF0337 family)